MATALRSYRSSSKRATALATAITFIGLLGLVTTISFAARPDTATDLDEPALPLRPRTTRSEADQDRLHALALFAEARTLEQNNETSDALAKYQRAFRYDPSSQTILRELIPLAFNLNRNALAVRYAAKFDGGDPQMLRRLGVLLTEQGKWKQALALYEKVLAAAPQEKTAAIALLRMEMGRLYFLDERPELAADCFVEVLRAIRDPEEYGLSKKLQKALRGDKGEGLELIFTVLLDAKRFASARQALDELLKSIDNPAIAAYHRASLAARADDRATAIIELTVYFEARETSRGYAPHELLRDVLIADKRADELMPMLEKQLVERPNDASLNFALAEEYRRAGQYDKAIPRYETALAKESSREAYRGLIASLAATKRTDQLLKRLGEIVDKSGSLDLLDGDKPVASAKKNSVEKSDEAKTKETLALEPLENEKLRSELIATALKEYDGKEASQAGVLRAAGLLAIDAKQWNDALTAFDRAIAAKPTDKAEILLQLGVRYLIGEQTDLAIKVFQRGVDERVLPDSNPVFSYYLAGALAFADRHDQALVAAKHAAEKQPRNLRFAARIPWVENHAKHYDVARDGYLELLKKHEDDYDKDETREVLRETRLLLSNIAVLQKDYPTAEEHLERVLDEFPDDVGAQNDLGYLWVEQNKRLARGLRMIETAIKAEPENQAYLDSLGWALYRHGRYTEALDAQLKAIAPRAGRETDGVVLDHLADIYAALDRKEDELTTRRRAMQALEKSDEQGKIEDVRKKLAARESR